MSKRIDTISESGIRKIFDMAAQMKNVINLSIGQPDFPVPKKVKESMIKAIKEDKTGYTPSGGIALLREKILKKYDGKKFAESSIITSGVSGGIFLSYSALLDPEDELIIFDPYFLIYPSMCTFLGIKPVIVKTNKDYSINFETLQKTITKKTKAIIINSPSNPTGYILSKQELEKLVVIAKKYNLWIISDEIYEDYDYDNKFTSVGDLYDKTIVLGGFAKNFALTGLRIGYAIGPKKIIEDMIKLQQHTFVCAPSIAQYAVLENIGLDISKEIKQFKKRRELVYNTLKSSFEVIKPTGAFYYYLLLPKGITGTAFAEKCLQNGLLVVPGKTFSGSDDHFRISYSTDDISLKKGLQILIEVIKSF